MRSYHRHLRISKHHQHHQESDQEDVDEDEYSTNQHSSPQTSSNNNDDDDDEVLDDDNYSYSSNISSSPSSSSPSSTYINIAPLPIFRGSPSECPLSHLSRFRHVCCANNAPSPSSIFPVTLDSHAALWYDLAIDPHPNMPWQEIQSSFLRFFLRPEHADRARTDLVNLKQGENESSGFFHLRMQWILRKWPGHGLPDSMLKGVFVDGLREDFQDWIVPQRPETLEEAVRLAENWERVRSMREARRRRESVITGKCGFCDGGHEERECDVRRRMRELWLRSGKGVAVGGEVGAGDVGEGKGGLGRMVSLGRKKCERSASVVSEKNAGTAAAD